MDGCCLAHSLGGRGSTAFKRSIGRLDLNQALSIEIASWMEPLILKELIQDRLMADAIEADLHSQLIWLQSKLGSKIVSLEIQGAENAQAIQTWLKTYLPSQASKERLTLFQKLDNLIAGNDSIARLVAGISFSMSLLLHQYDPKTFPLNLKDLKQHLKKQETFSQRELAEAGYPTTAFVYRTLTNAEIEQYIRHLETPEAQRINQLIDQILFLPMENHLSQLMEQTFLPSSKEPQKPHFPTPTDLQKIAEIANQKLPFFIDLFTQLIRISAKGMVLTYHYQIIDDQLVADRDQFIQRMVPLITQQSCQNRDLAILFSQGVSLQYDYVDEHQSPLMNLLLTPFDCGHEDYFFHGDWLGKLSFDVPHTQTGHSCQESKFILTALGSRVQGALLSDEEQVLYGKINQKGELRAKLFLTGKEIVKLTGVANPDELVGSYHTNYGCSGTWKAYKTPSVPNIPTKHKI